MAAQGTNLTGKLALQRVEAEIGHPLEEVKLQFVRSVAPNKDMYCISFSLPRAVAFAC